jgi:hypothetical protein
VSGAALPIARIIKSAAPRGVGCEPPAAARSAPRERAARLRLNQRPRASRCVRRAAPGADRPPTPPTAGGHGGCLANRCARKARDK